MRLRLFTLAALASVAALSSCRFFSQPWGGPLGGAYFVVDAESHRATGYAEDPGGGHPRVTYDESGRFGGQAVAGNNVGHSFAEPKPMPMHGYLQQFCRADANAVPSEQMAVSRTAAEGKAHISQTIILPQDGDWLLEVSRGWVMNASWPNAGSDYSWKVTLKEAVPNGTVFASWDGPGIRLRSMPNSHGYPGPNDQTKRSEVFRLRRGMRYIVECEVTATVFSERQPVNRDPGFSYPYGRADVSVTVLLAKQ